MAERWPALLSKSDAAEYLGIGVTTLNGLRARGELSTVLIGDGRIVRYRRSDLDRFIESLKEGQAKLPAECVR